MSFLEVHTKAAVFFVLGALFSGIVVATTLYADAQFGPHRPQTLNSLRWVTQRQELSAGGLAFVVAKCSATEKVVSGGYDLVPRGADPAKIYLLAALPEPGENGYKLYVANGSSVSILVFSYAGCAAT